MAEIEADKAIKGIDMAIDILLEKRRFIKKRKAKGKGNPVSVELVTHTDFMPITMRSRYDEVMHVFLGESTTTLTISTDNYKNRYKAIKKERKRRKQSRADYGYGNT